MARSWELRLISAGFLLLALRVSFGQEPQPGAPTATIKVQVKQVLVPVVVTDRKGHYVTGLKASDFQVFEDGAPQQLVAFSTEQEGAAELFQSAPSPVAPKPPPVGPGGATGANLVPRRTYLICLDTLNSTFGNFSQVRSALGKLFRQERSSDSQYALLALGRQALVIQNLTPEPATMLAAIENQQLVKAIQRSESMNLAVQEYQLSSMLGEYCQKCACAGLSIPSSRTSGGSDQVCMEKWQKIEMWAGSAAQERSVFTRNFLRELRETVEQLTRQPGKRTLILVSDGFNLRPGRDLFGMMAAYSRDPGELLRNPGDTLESDLQAIVRLAAAHDVTFYTLDSRGLYTSPAGGYDASGEYQMSRIVVILPEIQQEKETIAIENQAAMGELAAATGGVFFHNSNDLLKGIRQSFAEGREYYVLAYVPTNRNADGKFRGIKVQVKGKDLVLRAKRGYWAPTS